MKTSLNNKNNALNSILEPTEKNFRYVGQFIKKCPVCQEPGCRVYFYETRLICDTRIKELIREREVNSPSPIKEFLLQHSYLVKFNQKEQTGQELNQREQAQQIRIYELRKRVFSQIIEQLARYYETAIKGNYYYDGMPEIKRGIRDWLENKIWQLLVVLGEPEHCRFNLEPTYWKEYDPAK